ncbi:MAG: hypothetical protein PVF68_13705 [Acidobacteriota bacterium]|jgi:hypothetical protein
MQPGRIAVARRRWLGPAALILAILPTPGRPDVAPPAHLRIVERDPGLYDLNWRVPLSLPPGAVPRPELPDRCRPQGEPRVVEESAARRLSQRWRCDESLAGRPVGMRYPDPRLTLATVVQVELISGDRFAHVLNPGERSWQLPEGTAAPDRLREARRDLLAGAAHAAGSWIHVAFLLATGVLAAAGARAAATPSRRLASVGAGPGAPLGVVRLVTAFSLGQLAGAPLAGRFPAGLVPATAIALGAAAALLAREALRPAASSRPMSAVAAAAGLLHGLGLAGALAGGAGATLPGRLIAILGMDAVHLAGAAGVAWLLSPASSRLRSPLAYAAGSGGMALAVGLSLGIGLPAPASDVPTGLPWEATPAATAPPAGIATPGSGATLQSFLSIEPFEVRHEAMLRLAGLARELGLAADGTIDPAAQDALVERLASLVLERSRVRIDGRPAAGVVQRAYFMTVDPTGALPRPRPIPESVASAVVGVVIAFPVPGMADAVELRWQPPPAGVTAIPATVIDPESVRTLTLSAADPALVWENTLSEQPIPDVAAVEVEPVTVRVPWLSIPLVLVAGLLLAAGVRRRRAGAGLAAARVLLAAAVIVGPVAPTALAVPGTGGGTPTPRQARRILAGLLPGIYRALEYRAPEAIYDRLAVAVTGEALETIYLQQRHALEMEERGGARARVEAVEVLEADGIAAARDGFTVHAVWTVGGMVTHFGHRHFRQNRYDARLEIVPNAGTWKLRAIDVLAQERLR